jgi:hypothetical protein
MADDASAIDENSRIDRLFDGGVSQSTKISSQLGAFLLVANSAGLFFVLFARHSSLAAYFPGVTSYALFLAGLVSSLVSIGWGILGSAHVTTHLAQLASDLRQREDVRHVRIELRRVGISDTPELDTLDRVAAARIYQFYTDSRRRWRIAIGPHLCNLLSAVTFVVGLATPLLIDVFDLSTIPSEPDGLGPASPLQSDPE